MVSSKLASLGAFTPISPVALIRGSNSLTEWEGEPPCEPPVCMARTESRLARREIGLAVWRDFSRIRSRVWPAPSGALPRRRTSRRGTRVRVVRRTQYTRNVERNSFRFSAPRPPNAGRSDPRAPDAGRTNRQPNCQRGSSGLERSRMSSAEFPLWLMGARRGWATGGLIAN